MIYQFFEFIMCRLNLRYSLIAYFAFAVITFLPPVNLIFIMNFLKKNYRFKFLSFLPGILFVIYYAFVIPQFKVVSCSPLYASYTYPLGTLYGIFYYLPLIISAVFIFFNLKKNDNKSRTFLKKILFGGHLILMLPVAAAFILLAINSPKLLSIIESIMCKFAIFYAVCLSVFSLKNSSKKNE